MRSWTVPVAFGVGIAALPMFALPAGPGTESAPAHATPAPIPIPESIQTEHKEIMAALTEATKAGGRVGPAAQDLAKVLHPHFEREEQIALPPLGLLAPLAAGERIPEDKMSAALSMSESLRAEMPRMLDEHKTIRQANEKLAAAARAEKAAKYEQFSEKLSVHARTEEEVLYPAAILVGDLVKARRGK